MYGISMSQVLTGRALDASHEARRRPRRRTLFSITWSRDATRSRSNLPHSNTEPTSTTAAWLTRSTNPPFHSDS